MPELPEVESLRRSLHALAHSTITDVEVLRPSVIAHPAPSDFREGLRGQSFAEHTQRRGKYLLLGLTNGGFLGVHLRMSGRLLLNPTAGYTHLRVRFSLAQGGALDFYDPRAFGRLWYIRPEESAQLIIPTLVRLGPEPEDLSAQHLITVFARRQIPIKTALLDQTCLAGLGNIYADESLFLAAIHPTTPANTLNLSQVTRLVAAIQQVLAKAIGLGGTTFRDYADSRGQIGRYQDVLNVYGRFQQLCKQCGTPIERLRLGGRSSHFCPLCQVYDRLSGNPMTTAP